MQKQNDFVYIYLECVTPTIQLAVQVISDLCRLFGKLKSRQCIAFYVSSANYISPFALSNWYSDCFAFLTLIK